MSIHLTPVVMRGSRTVAPAYTGGCPRLDAERGGVRALLDYL
jgi:hypothetical protein